MCSNRFTNLFLFLSWLLATKSTEYIGKKKQEISTEAKASARFILATRRCHPPGTRSATRSLPASDCWIKFVDGFDWLVLGESEDMAKPADATLGCKTRCAKLLCTDPEAR